MLTPQEQQEIEAEIPHYERRQALCIEALKIVQKHRRWVSNDALRDIAEFLGMTTHEVDSVATFYNLVYRREVGRNVIHVCDSVSCWVMGCESICEHLRKSLGVELGGTTDDGRFTLLPVPCLGICDKAPAMLVGEDLHTDLTPEKLEEILPRYS